MAAPTSPYTTAEKVSYLLLHLFKGAVPSISTIPDATKVTQAIAWAAAQLEMVYSEVGYVIPFTEINGETWLIHQTAYLDITNALGAAGFVGGHMLRPAPAIGPTQGQQFGNLYQELFSKELDALNIGKGKRLRAQYYAGTPAEQMLADYMGPRLDHLDEVYDITRYQGLWDLVETFDKYRTDIEELDLDWNWFEDWKAAMVL